MACLVKRIPYLIGKWSGENERVNIIRTYDV